MIQWFPALAAIGSVLERGWRVRLAGARPADDEPARISAAIDAGVDRTFLGLSNRPGPALVEALVTALTFTGSAVAAS